MSRIKSNSSNFCSLSQNQYFKRSVIDILIQMELVKTKATISDIDRVKTLLEAAARIPLSKGINQWPVSFDTKFIAKQISERGVFLFSIDSEIVGTVDIKDKDVAIWDSNSENAIYLHRLAIDPKYSGRGVGKQIIAEVIKQAIADGYDLIRLDCVTLNIELRNYYEKLGFDYVKDIRWAGGESSLYELNLMHR